MRNFSTALIIAKFITAIAILHVNKSGQLMAQVSEKSNTATIAYELTKQPDPSCEKLTTGQWWKKKNKIIDVNVDRDQVIAFALYTHDRGTLKLTAQLYPLYPKRIIRNHP